jgi:hypothetical protein
MKVVVFLIFFYRSTVSRFQTELQEKAILNRDSEKAHDTENPKEGSLLSPASRWKIEPQNLTRKVFRQKGTGIFSEARPF